MLRSAWKAFRSWLGRLAREVRGLGGELGAERVDRLAALLEHGRHRVLGQPVDLEVRMMPASSSAIADVAHRVAQADGRREVQRAPTPGQRASPGPGGRRGRSSVIVRSRLRQRSDEVADQEVREDRVAARDHVVRALDDDKWRAGELRESLARGPAAGTCPPCRGRAASGSVTARQVASIWATSNGEAHLSIRRASPRRSRRAPTPTASSIALRGVWLGRDLGRRRRRRSQA